MIAGELVEALRAAAGVVVPRTYLVGEQLLEPPCCVLVPPRIEWNGPTADPTDASLVLAMVVAQGDRSARDLLGLVEGLVEALDTCDVDVVIRAAEPGFYPVGSTELPAYLIEIEASLDGR